MKKHEMIEELHYQVWLKASYLKTDYEKFQRGEATEHELLTSYAVFETTSKLAKKLLDTKDYVSAHIGLPQNLPTATDVVNAIEKGKQK